MKRLSFLPFAAILLAWPSASMAEVIMYIYQSGAYVDAYASGSLDITDLTIQGNVGSQATVGGTNAGLTVGPASQVTPYSGISGPTGFGSSGFTTADAGTGQVFGVVGGIHRVYLPAGYSSGASLTGTAEWDSTTLSGLGLTTGTYTYTWGTGADADSLVVNIGTAPPAVPEPGSMTLVVSAGVIGLGVRFWSSRRRAARA